MNASETDSTQSRAESEAGKGIGAGGGSKSAASSERDPSRIPRPDYAQCRTADLSPELARVVKAWPELPEAIRAAIMALVQSATGQAL